jgi:pimeloyl-ACP methyl ester carboxylesterase
LRVVAGDVEGDSVVSWVKTLLADAFFWTDNDLVVQTRSMYGGAPRGPARAQFLLDAGGKVTHFNYFANEHTVLAVVDGLTQDTPKQFRSIGPLSWAGEDASGVRAARVVRESSAARPAVFVLPGILGSHLKVNEKRVWLSWRIVAGLRRLEYTGKADHVAPDGPIGIFYNDLIEFLSDTHEVIPFAFDWRKPIEKEASRLGSEVERAIAARRTSGQPVRLIAHSMGGIVARAMMLERPDVWSQLIAHEGARLLMLGTPNAGSWAPMQVLSGDDDLGNTLAFVGAPMHDQQARQLMAEMPGLLQLQAKLRDEQLALCEEKTWRQLADDDLRIILMNSWWHSDALQKGAYRWGIPPQHILDLAVRLRTRLDEQLALPGFGKQLALVVGRAKFTPDGYTLSSDGLDYLNAVDGGDGRVTLAEALLPGVPTWLLDCAHSELADEEQAFDAYFDLLTKGDTKRLERLGARRGEPREEAESITHVRSRPSRGLVPRLTPLESLHAVLEGSSAVPELHATAPRGVAVRVTVLNGNLKFLRQPLMLGHYRAGILTGAERTVDKLIGGSMEQSLRLRRYPHWPGSSDVFVNRHRDPNDPRLTPQPAAVIVVGLGEEGELTSAALSLTVRQGVIGWVKRVVESAGGAPTHIELAATLIGSGGAGISAGVSAQAIAQGVRDANEQLTSLGWPVVSHLLLVELFENRAIEAWQALELQAAAAPGNFQVAERIETGTGRLERPLDLDYRGADHDFIRACWIDDGVEDGKIEYTVDTRRARSELRARSAQGKLLQSFLTSASNDGNRDEQIGRTLFQLLVPLEIQPLLGGTGQIVLELDPKTACIPWELLETPDERGDRSDRRPWAIRSRLIRKLRTGVFREEVADAGADDNVLVIGDPLCDDRSLYPSLPGAHAEAQAVARQLGAADVVRGQQRVHVLPRDADMRSVLNALFSRPYRIVHVAGHGKEGTLGGVVLSGGSFLGPREIESMVVVPQLVFVNCCHLAARDFDAPASPYDRAAFAASVAAALINIGVRCVIAAGWAVDDRAAQVFATAFYEQLLQHRKFMDAVTIAREAARQIPGNTWAAYQCYGDPDWSYRTDGETITPDAASMRETYSMIASPTQLAGALEALSVESRIERKLAGLQSEKIAYLEERFAGAWGNAGNIAEAFAAAYADDGAILDGIRWLEKALHADGTASVRAQERILQLQITRAWRDFEAAQHTCDIAVNEIVARARETIRDAAAELATLADSRRTFETLSACGSAWERLARLEGAARDALAERAAIENMARYYAAAEQIALDADRADLANAALNRMAAELVLHANDPHWRGFDAGTSRELRARFAAQVAAEPRFETVVATHELELYDAVAERTLAARWSELRADFEDLHERASGTLLWKSPYSRAELALQRVMGRCSEQDSAIEALLALLRTFADEHATASASASGG